jgi:hypothetical protein
VTQTTSQLPSVKTTTIDARGPRFSALITTLVLVAALASHLVWVIAFQLLVFAIGALRGPQFTPYAFLFRKFVRPRLKGDVPVEDIRPPQFAQSVGLIFALVATIGLVSHISPLFTIAAGAALAAAFLNVAFNYCLGCEVYLLILRLR